jgi:hypothetical protein
VFPFIKYSHFHVVNQPVFAASDKASRSLFAMSGFRGWRATCCTTTSRFVGRWLMVLVLICFVQKDIQFHVLVSPEILDERIQMRPLWLHAELFPVLLGAVQLVLLAFIQPFRMGFAKQV